LRSTGRPSRPSVLVISVVLAVIGSLLAVAEPAAVRGDTPDDLLPDLELMPIYGVTLRTTNTGRKRIRFGTRAANIGAGPLEVRGRARNQKRMTEIYQFIYSAQGGGREIAQPDSTMFWAGDGHNHWHVDRFVSVEFYKVGATQTRRIRKIGFCLMDSLRSSQKVPNTPEVRGYGPGGCGNKVQMESLQMGISVGWADDYPPMIRFQWIDITGLPRGVYRLCARVNPLGRWLESNAENNYYWQDVWVNRGLTQFQLRGSGRTACGVPG
jgi:hypothetical protein